MSKFKVGAIVVRNPRDMAVGRWRKENVPDLHGHYVVSSVIISGSLYSEIQLVGLTGTWNAEYFNLYEPSSVSVKDLAGTITPMMDTTSPSHYSNQDIEPIDYIMGNDFAFWRGNIIKYASRAGSKIYEGCNSAKSEIKDLEKVRRYAEMRINQLNGEETL